MQFFRYIIFTSFLIIRFLNEQQTVAVLDFEGRGINVLLANDTSYVFSNISKGIEVTFEAIATDSSWNFLKSETQITYSNEFDVSTSEGNLYTINTKSIYAVKNLK